MSNTVKQWAQPKTENKGPTDSEIGILQDAVNRVETGRYNAFHNDRELLGSDEMSKLVYKETRHCS